MFFRCQRNSLRTSSPGQEVEHYWKSIWDKDAMHNNNAQWLVDLRAHHGNLHPEHASVTVTMGDIQETAWRVGQDQGLLSSLLNKLTALNECLAAQTNQLLMHLMHPEWPAAGQIVLILKNLQKGLVPSNYWPKICLSTTWMLLLGIIAANMNRHMVHTLISRTVQD